MTVSLFFDKTNKFSFVFRPAIVVLLMSMVNERQPFVLRCAVLYCFQSFLYKNELGQSQIVQTLLPNTAEGRLVVFIFYLFSTRSITPPT